MYPVIPSAQTVILTCLKLGITTVVISPGSRNAPLAIGFASNDAFKCYSIVDERSAGFFSLGIAQQIKKPVILLCTSGSAILNYAPAIAEAFYSQIPLIVLSADRPKYKINIGDGQTIDQSKVFGNNIFSSDSLKQDITHNLKAITISNRQKILNSELEVNEINKLQIKIQKFNEDLLNKRFNESFVFRKPVHINIPLEEPLYDFIETPCVNLNNKVKFNNEKLIKKINSNFENIIEKYSKIMILAGSCSPNYLDDKIIDKIKRNSNIVVLTESTSNLHDDSFFENIDQIIAPIELIKSKNDLFSSLKPEILITIGGMIISKKIKSFLRNFPPNIHLHVGINDANDTYFKGVKHVQTTPKIFFEKLLEKTNSASNYHKAWNTLSKKRFLAHEKFIKKTNYSDLVIFHILSSRIPSKYQVHVANSSPVRYLQLFKFSKLNNTFCNRGTSGIEGSTSTAVGASVANNTPTVLITGDLSFFYDINGLWNNYINSDFRIILINNNGGGIFRILPGFKDDEIFSKYIETKHSLNAKQIAKTYGFKYQNKKTAFGVKFALKTFFKKSNRPKILEITTPSHLSSSTLKNYFKFLANS